MSFAYRLKHSLTFLSHYVISNEQYLRQKRKKYHKKPLPIIDALKRTEAGRIEGKSVVILTQWI